MIVCVCTHSIALSLVVLFGLKVHCPRARLRVGARAAPCSCWSRSRPRVAAKAALPARAGIASFLIMFMLNLGRVCVFALVCGASASLCAACMLFAVFGPWSPLHTRALNYFPYPILCTVLSVCALVYLEGGGFACCGCVGVFSFSCRVQLVLENVYKQTNKQTVESLWLRTVRAAPKPFWPGKAGMLTCSVFMALACQIRCHVQ